MFNGTDPNGTWQLFVFDDAGGDRGDIAEGWDLTITTNPCITALDQQLPDDIDTAVFNLESELSNAFQVILDTGDPDQIERFIKLLINKELLLLLIREEVAGGNGNASACPCKFRIGISGNAAPANVIVTRTGQEDLNLSGTINVSAEQCFTGARRCNPSVDSFDVSFVAGGTTINFTQGRRTTITCEDGTFARLVGTAQAEGGLLSGGFNIDIQLTVDPNTNSGTWRVFAQSFDGNTTFFTTFTADVSPRTFIGACTENVNPN